MLNYVLKKVKGFFQKKRKQNNIQIDSVKNGNIYQDSIIKVENPAIAISHIKDNPEDLKITLDSISNILLRQSKALPQGYQVVVKMKDGKADIHSEPINDEARKQYPQKVKATAKIDIPIDMSFREALDRARISQTPINIEMLDMQKMIGDKIDPYQEQFQKEWRKRTFKIVPEELPAGINCVIGIEGVSYRYDTVMRMQPVNPDADIIKISNKEYATDFVLALTYHMDTKATEFTYRFSGNSWKSIYKFLNFMKAAIPGNRLFICMAEQNKDLFSTKLDQCLFGGEYDSINYNIDIAKRLIMIENQYGIQFPTNQDLSDEDIELIGFLSNSIMGKPSGFTWESFSVTANLHVIKLNGINSEARLEFKETASITILGQRITDLIVRVELESAKIVNLDIIREAVKTHKTEQIQISLIPGNNGNHGTRMVVL